MKKIIFCLILLVVGVTSCQKEAIKSIIENNTSVLTKEQQESLDDGLNIVKNLTANKQLDFYEIVPEKFRGRINSKLKAASVNLYHDKAKNGFYFIYNFSENGAFINGLGSCSKKFVYDNLGRIECKGQGSDCDILTNPDGSWELIICTL